MSNTWQKLLAATLFISLWNFGVPVLITEDWVWFLLDMWDALFMLLWASAWLAGTYFYPPDQQKRRPSLPRLLITLTFMFVPLVAIYDRSFGPASGRASAWSLLGGFLFLVGAVLGLSAWRALQSWYAPDPIILRDQELITIGPYRRVRHLMYTAALVSLPALALILRSVGGAVLGIALLAPALWLRIHEEERPDTLSHQVSWWGNLMRRLIHRSAQVPRMPHLSVWQRALTHKYGSLFAQELTDQLQTRFAELYRKRQSVTHPALRKHHEESILLGLTLYQVLGEAFNDPEVVQEEWERLFRARIGRNSKTKLLRFLSHLSNPFNVFRWANRRAIKRQFPSAGWQINWMEDNTQSIAYNIHECFYLKILTQYNAPELTRQFCKLDDVMFEALPSTISWERSQTLAQGADYCDFRWRLIAQET